MQHFFGQIGDRELLLLLSRRSRILGFDCSELLLLWLGFDGHGEVQEVGEDG